MKEKVARAIYRSFNKYNPQADYDYVTGTLKKDWEKTAQAAITTVIDGLLRKRIEILKK